MAKSQKYYAVIKGKVNEPTIFENWNECSKATQGVSNAKFKGFESYEGALSYIRENCGNIIADKTNKRYHKSKNQAIKNNRESSYKKKEAVFRSIRDKKQGSVGEDVVEMHLKIDGYQYSKEYEVNINNVTFRFDYAIFNSNKLEGFIEFDGIQHFEAIDTFGGEKGLSKTRYRDELKNSYCIDKGLKLLRIRYSDGHKSKEMIEKIFKKPDNKPTKKKCTWDTAIEKNNNVTTEKLSFEGLSSILGINVTKQELIDMIVNSTLGNLKTMGTINFYSIEASSKSRIKYLIFKSIGKKYQVEVDLNIPLKKSKDKIKSKTTK